MSFLNTDSTKSKKNKDDKDKPDKKKPDGDKEKEKSGERNLSFTEKVL